MPAMTRGPLPSSVYWRRRLIAITVVLVIVAVALKVFGHGGGTAPKAAPTANLTHPQSSPASPSVTPDPTPDPTVGSTPTAAPTPSGTPTPTAPPIPSGPCAASDVTVVPSVTGAAAGTPVPVVLTLQTAKTPACTWQVSHKTVQVKITSASGAAVWSTVQCPKAVPTSDVVVYRDTPTTVEVDWSARRADDDCSTHTAWSKPGDYQVTAVALGGEPSQAAFALGQPGSVAPATPASPTTSTTGPATGASAPAGTPAGAATTPGATPTAGGPSSPAQPKKHKHKKKQPIVD